MARQRIRRLQEQFHASAAQLEILEIRLALRLLDISESVAERCERNTSVFLSRINAIY
ncbi:hypothetical protein FRC11_009932, partial [Ceratobasidium sp. 423]